MQSVPLPNGRGAKGYDLFRSALAANREAGMSRVSPCLPVKLDDVRPRLLARDLDTGAGALALDHLARMACAIDTQCQPALHAGEGDRLENLQGLQRFPFVFVHAPIIARMF